MIRLALAFFLLCTPAWAYDSTAVTLFAAMTTPPTSYRKDVINQLIVSLKNASVWAKLDVFYVLAVADSQQSTLNWVTPASNTTTDVGAVTWTADVGTSAGVYPTIVRDTHWTPSTQAVNFTQNSASIFAWSGTDTRASGEYFWAQPSGTVALALNPRTSDADGSHPNVAACSINDSGGNFPPPPSIILGLFTVNRTSSTNFDFYQNTTNLGSITKTTNGIPAVSMLIGATSRIMKMGGAGAALTSQNITDLYNAYNTYLGCIASGTCTFGGGGSSKGSISPLEPKPAASRLFNGFE